MWGNTFESNNKPISKLQNRVIRLISKMFIVIYSIKKYLMKFTDIVKLKTLIVMFKASLQILLLIIYNNCLFLKIRTGRKSFCVSIISPTLWDYYYNMINIKKNIITFKKDVKKCF